ncbi:MAG: SPOR domain-containing protein [Bacteroidaceae bacterium]|nr:SPOR domain-containing protein [Bacteroidaceae bacterium]
MRILSLIAFVFMVATATMKAQTTFVERVQSEVEGQGMFEVEQDPRLTAIVNGEEVVPSSIATTSKVSAITTENKVRQDADDLRGKASGLHQKVRGYRVQVFFGGSQRSEESQAKRVGTRVTSMFPELRAYTSFASPHWRCRVGDFIKHEDATAYMHKIKARGISEAMVVKSEIYVSADQLKNNQ